MKKVMIVGCMCLVCATMLIGCSAGVGYRKDGSLTKAGAWFNSHDVKIDKDEKTVTKSPE